MNSIPGAIKIKLDAYLGGADDILYVRAPGRINLIGEHTDYNNGLVLPGAINKYMYFAASPNGTNEINATAIDLNESIVLDLSNLIKTNRLWADYLTGILLEFKKRNIQLSGFDCALTSQVPIGAGISSSSALECAFLVGIKELHGLDIDNWELIKMSQSSNHNFLGIKGGILDQFSSLFGKRDKIMLLDCDSLDYQYVTIPTNKYTWLLINTNVQHNHLNSGYNDRVKECGTALKDVQKTYPDVQHLSSIKDLYDLSLIHFSNPIIEKRARYIVEENARVKSFITAIEKSQFEKCGELLYASHKGLQENYEVSCKELDFLVDHLKDNSSVLGSRMMGGGFGGCTINLVEESTVLEITDLVSTSYFEAFGIEPAFYVVEISEGAERLRF